MVVQVKRGRDLCVGTWVEFRRRAGVGGGEFLGIVVEGEPALNDGLRTCWG